VEHVIVHYVIFRKYTEIHFWVVTPCSVVVGYQYLYPTILQCHNPKTLIWIFTAVKTSSHANTIQLQKHIPRTNNTITDLIIYIITLLINSIHLVHYPYVRIYTH